MKSRRALADLPPGWHHQVCPQHLDHQQTLPEPHLDRLGPLKQQKKTRRSQGRGVHSGSGVGGFSELPLHSMDAVLTGRNGPKRKTQKMADPTEFMLLEDMM